MLWRRKWQPTPVLLPGKFQGHRRMAGYCPRDHSQSPVSDQHTNTALHLIEVYLVKWRASKILASMKVNFVQKICVGFIIGNILLRSPWKPIFCFGWVFFVFCLFVCFWLINYSCDPKHIGFVWLNSSLKKPKPQIKISGFHWTLVWWLFWPPLLKFSSPSLLFLPHQGGKGKSVLTQIHEPQLLFLPNHFPCKIMVPTQLCCLKPEQKGRNPSRDSIYLEPWACCTAPCSLAPPTKQKPITVKMPSSSRALPLFISFDFTSLFLACNPFSAIYYISEYSISASPFCYSKFKVCFPL